MALPKVTVEWIDVTSRGFCGLWKAKAYLGFWDVGNVSGFISWRTENRTSAQMIRDKWLKVFKMFSCYRQFRDIQARCTYRQLDPIGLIWQFEYSIVYYFDCTDLLLKNYICPLVWLRSPQVLRLGCFLSFEIPSKWCYIGFRFPMLVQHNAHL